MILQDNSAGLSSSSIVEILQRLEEVPKPWRKHLRNNGGGFVNHIFYWETMCPSSESQGVGPAAGPLANDIVAAFRNFEAFKSEFSSAAASLFGSGYVWLCENATGDLSIVSTQNQVGRVHNISSNDISEPMSRIHR